MFESFPRNKRRATKTKDKIAQCPFVNFLLGKRLLHEAKEECKWDCYRTFEDLKMRKKSTKTVKFFHCFCFRSSSFISK